MMLDRSSMVYRNTSSSSAASGSTSRGTARSTMNIGAGRRVLLARPGLPLPTMASGRGGGGGTNDWVSRPQPLRQLGERDGVGRKTRRELRAALQRAVGDGDRLR